jgi:rhodanese-related sulfurtransferase
LQPEYVEAATVRGWLDRPDAVTVLDVRTPAEFQTAHIRGLPADRLRRWFAYLVLAIAAFMVAQALLNPAAAAGGPGQG